MIHSFLVLCPPVRGRTLQLRYRMHAKSVRILFYAILTALKIIFFRFFT